MDQGSVAHFTLSRDAHWSQDTRLRPACFVLIARATGLTGYHLLVSRDQLLSCAGKDLPCSYIWYTTIPELSVLATCTIAVYFPQLQHLIPDPIRELQCSFSFDNTFDTPIGSGISWSQIHALRNESLEFHATNNMDQGSVRRGSKYFYHRYLSGFLYRSDPRSKRLSRVLKHLIPIGSGISSNKGLIRLVWLNPL